MPSYIATSALSSQPVCRRQHIHPAIRIIEGMTDASNNTLVSEGSMRCDSLYMPLLPRRRWEDSSLNSREYCKCKRRNRDRQPPMVPWCTISTTSPLNDSKGDSPVTCEYVIVKACVWRGTCLRDHWHEASTATTSTSNDRAILSHRILRLLTFEAP